MISNAAKHMNIDWRDMYTYLNVYAAPVFGNSALTFWISRTRTATKTKRANMLTTMTNECLVRVGVKVRVKVMKGSNKLSGLNSVLRV
jgi:hypothetical protein